MKTPRKPVRQRLLTNARIIDPSSGLNIRGEMLIKRRKIVAVAESIDRSLVREDCRITDCGGAVLAPGLIDTRVRIGEPGGEHRETIASASRSAAAGGVTGLVMLPETNPVIDDAALVEFVRRTAESVGRVHIYPMAALSKRLAGEEITEIGLLSKAGAVAFGDGSKSVANAQLQRRALLYARDFDALIVAATNDTDLAGSGVMNAGAMATRMGLSGIPREAEIIPLERDMRLVAMTSGKYHAATLSTAEGCDIIAKARQSGLNVSAGVAVANLTLNETDTAGYRTFFKLSPPLRFEDDRKALVEAVRDGVIDVICSNHDPQNVDTKRLPFAQAADGAVGLDTLLAAGLRLVHAGNISLERLLYCLSTGPARRFGLPGGTLDIGAPADLVLFDPDEPWILSEVDIQSRSKNTAYENARFTGRVLKTFVEGRKVYSRDPN